MSYPRPTTIDITTPGRSTPAVATKHLTTPGIAAHVGTGFLRHRVGDSIKNRYEVRALLGGGNFGSVYRVHDTVVGVELACKEMHVLDDPRTAQNEREGAIGSFKREALTLATLRHPHIPAAYFEQEEGYWHVCPVCGFDFPGAQYCPDHGASLVLLTERYYLMMDYIDGPTLEELAQRRLREEGRPLEEAQCIEWIAQISSALRTLHKVGIVHRDVKPDNIKIRSADNAAILLDFGLTKKAEEAGGYGTVAISGTGRFGTPGYAPPNPREQERPEPRSDIHALGMTLLRLLSGRDPGDAADLQALREHSARTFNPAISPDIERVIGLAIAPRAETRYQSIDDLLADLEELRGTQTSYQAPPFTFANGQRARSVGDLARLVERHPNEALNYLFNGMFADWLRLCGLAAPAQVAMTVVKRYGRDPARALEVFRRSLYPTGTAGVLPRVVTEPASLDFGTLDSGAKSTHTLRIRNAGAGLAWGTLKSEAVSTGGKTSAVESLPGLSFAPAFQGNDVSLEVTLDTARVANGAYSGALVLQSDNETVRVPVAYSVNPLQLRVEPPELNLGSILVGRRGSRHLKITPLQPDEGQPSEGKPRGTIFVGSNLTGASAPERFEGIDSFEIAVDAGAAGVVATRYEGALHLDTNGGRIRVPVRYRIVMPPGRILTLILSWLCIGALGGAALRLAYALINPEYFARWLISFQPGGAVVLPFELQHGWLQLTGALGGAVAASRLTHRLAARTGVQKHESQFWLLSFGAILGAVVSLCLAFVLHWALWGFGDWLLAPLAQLEGTSWSLKGLNSPPLMWALAGGTGGVLLGICRALSAIGQKRARAAAYVLLGLLFLAIVINAMLFTGL